MYSSTGSEAHVRHARTATGWCVLGVLEFRDRTVGRQQEAADACGILQSDPFHLGGHDDPAFKQVLVGPGQCIESEVGFIGLDDFLAHDGPVDAAVLGDLTDGSGQGAMDDVHAEAARKGVAGLFFLRWALTPGLNEQQETRRLVKLAIGVDRMFRCVELWENLHRAWKRQVLSGEGPFFSEGPPPA